MGFETHVGYFYVLTLVEEYLNVLLFGLQYFEVFTFIFLAKVKKEIFVIQMFVCLFF